MNRRFTPSQPSGASPDEIPQCVDKAYSCAPPGTDRKPAAYKVQWFLLNTTAAVGVSAVAASAVAMPLQSRDEEGTPILSASMNASFEAGFANNSAADSSVDRDSGFVVGRWADVYFNGEMTADNGLTYGAQIRIAANGTDVDLAGLSGLGRQYIWLKGSWGSIEAGTWTGAETALTLNIAGQYKGGGGLDYAYKTYIVGPAGYIERSINPHFWDVGQYKVTYYTPVFNGFQAGISYTPTVDGGNDGTTAGDGKYKDEIGYAAQWSGDMGGSTVTLAVVGAISDDAVDNAKMETRHGAEMFQIGGMVSHAGFSAGATFWDYGDTGTLPMDSQDYTGWAVDATYSFGPYGVEISYAHAEKAITGMEAIESTFDGWALQIGYAVAPGLKWYADLVGAEFDVNGETDDSTVVLTGVNVNF